MDELGFQGRIENILLKYMAIDMRVLEYLNLELSSRNLWQHIIIRKWNDLITIIASKFNFIIFIHWSQFFPAKIKCICRDREGTFVQV